MNTDIIYQTAITTEGKCLLGGVWRLYRQEGFPVDLSFITIREMGHRPDYMEMMAEATMHGELERLMRQYPEIFTDEVKNKFALYLLSHGSDTLGFEKAAENIVNQKRSMNLDKLGEMREEICKLKNSSKP